MSYDPERAAAFYDEYGEREWQRFETGSTSRVSLELHRHYLQKFVRPGDRVLDVGAGPGRFTLELARLGAHVVVADISPGQLALNRERLAEAALEGQVLDRVVADVVDLSQFEEASFDAVVCYGGPLSYVLDRADEAVAELIRVARPDGHVLLSVMSLVGTFTGWLDAILKLPEEANDEIVRTGLLPSTIWGGHLAMRLYRWRELEALLLRHPCTVVAASASNLNRAVEASVLPEALDALVRWAVDLCAEPGAIDCGQHIVAVVRKLR